MSNGSDKSNAELRTFQSQSEDVLTALVETLQEGPDIQDVIRSLMQPADMLERFSQIGVEDPDLARLVLEAGMAALVNTQSMKAIEAELKRRVDRN